MSQIMDEYAVWFFVLLGEAYKLKAQELSFNAQASCVPHMEDKDRKRYFNNLERSQHDIIEEDDYSGLETLKKEFNG